MLCEALDGVVGGATNEVSSWLSRTEIAPVRISFRGRHRKTAFGLARALEG